MAKGELKYIYCFAYYNLDSPSVRYRLQYPLEWARKNKNAKVELIIPGYKLTNLSKFLRCYLTLLFRPKNQTIVFIQRIRSRFVYASMLKLLVKSKRVITVYDLDDADYLTYNQKTIHFFAKHCDYVAAGSKEIATYLEQFNRNVFHLSSPISSSITIKKQRNLIVNIGWIGGFRWGHRESMFEFLFPAIKQLNINCKLSLLAVTKEHHRKEIEAYFQDCDHVNLYMPLTINWHDEKQIQHEISQFDVGIATLKNTEIQRSKSGIKVKQYLNNGIPVLCNNLPENNRVVVHEKNGYFCDSPDEFCERIEQLHNMDDKAYFDLSERASCSVESYRHENWFNLVSSLLKD